MDIISLLIIIYVSMPNAIGCTGMACLASLFILQKRHALPLSFIFHPQINIIMYNNRCKAPNENGNFIGI